MTMDELRDRPRADGASYRALRPTFALGAHRLNGTALAADCRV